MVLSDSPPPVKIKASVESLKAVREGLKDPASMTPLQLKLASSCVDAFVWIILFLKSPGVSIRKLRKILGVVKEVVVLPEEKEEETQSSQEEDSSNSEESKEATESPTDEDKSQKKKPSKTGGRFL